MAIQPVNAAVTTVQTTRTQQVSAVRETSAADSAHSVETKQAAAAVVQPSPEQIDRAMAEVKRALPPVARNLQFSIDKDTGRSVVKVVDSSTNEVIRQIPSEELLAIARSIDNFSGLFVKQKA